MADVRPLPGIRYAAIGELANLVTPPYDVISPEAQERYYKRHPHNIIRLELGRDEPSDDELENRYTRAASTFAEWRLHHVFTQDAPCFYLYEQRFSALGSEHTKLSVMARVRLEPWDAGIILPHEYTLSKPKNDRLKLLRACAANFSPGMALYDDPQGELAAQLAALSGREPDVDFTDEAGEGHRLWLLHDEDLTDRIASFFADRQLYIADGHHRYETALAYRDEVAAARKERLAPDDAANFTLMALSAIEDPGLVVLPTHRMLRNLEPSRLASLYDRLEQYFTIGRLGPEVDAETIMVMVTAATQSNELTTFAVIQPDGALLLQLRPEGIAAMDSLTGTAADASEAWRRLDVAVLHELVLREGLGVTDEMLRSGEYVSYTRDANAALQAVHHRTAGTELALLLNPAPPSAIRDVACAGDRMPQKSTYFYPKLITGLVINPLW